MKRTPLFLCHQHVEFAQELVLSNSFTTWHRVRPDGFEHLVDVFGHGGACGWESVTAGGGRRSSSCRSSLLSQLSRRCRERAVVNGRRVWRTQTMG